MKRHQKQELKRQQAEERREARQKRGLLGQIRRLEEKGHTHCKEYKRLKSEHAAQVKIANEIVQEIIEEEKQG